MVGRRRRRKGRMERGVSKESGSLHMGTLLYCNDSDLFW